MQYSFQYVFHVPETGKNEHSPSIKLIWLFYPETANRQLEDIDQLYQEQKSMVFVIANKEAIQVHRPERFIEAQRDRQRIEKATQPTSGELSNTTDTTLVV